MGIRPTRRESRKGGSPQALAPRGRPWLCANKASPTRALEPGCLEGQRCCSPDPGPPPGWAHRRLAAHQPGGHGRDSPSRAQAGRREQSCPPGSRAACPRRPPAAAEAPGASGKSGRQRPQPIARTRRLNPSLGRRPAPWGDTRTPVPVPEAWRLPTFLGASLPRRGTKSSLARDTEHRPSPAMPHTSGLSSRLFPGALVSLLPAGPG